MRLTMIRFRRSYVQILVFFALVVRPSVIQAQETIAKSGVLDARSWDLQNERLPLTGEWQFYENQLLSPNELEAASPGLTSHFPQIWSESLNNKVPDFGTYRLQVILPTRAGTYALEMPQVYSSYRLFVNGTEIAHNGTVGTTPEQSRPQWLPQTVAFTSKSESLQLVLQISNFHHRLGGAKDTIYLGFSEMMQDHRSLAAGSNLVEAGTLLLLGIAFLVVWFTERKKAVLYFTLLCITWALRAVFSNLYMAIAAFPDFDWFVQVRIEYITLYLTMIWAILLLGRLFPLDSSLIIKYLLVGVNILFVGVTLFSKPIFFTQLLPVYLGFCAFLLAYAMYIIVRAWINDHAGVWYVIGSALLGIAIFAYDFFSYEGIFSYNPIVFGLGYILIFLMMSVSLLFHLNIIRSKPSSAMLTYQELYGDSVKPMQK